MNYTPVTVPMWSDFNAAVPTKLVRETLDLIISLRSTIVGWAYNTSGRSPDRRVDGFQVVHVNGRGNLGISYYDMQGICYRDRMLHSA